MTETAQNFTIWAGDYRQLVFTITGITDTDAVSAIDFRMERYIGGTHVVNKDLTDGITMSDATGMLVVTVTLEAEDTEGYAGVYSHELQLTDTATHPETVAVGMAVVNAALIVPVTS